jgi:thiamine-monophosphate kinase
MERQAYLVRAVEGPTVADIGERALIERIRSRLPPPPAWVVVGIGDDAAVVEPERNRLDVVTTDASVEGVHFERRYSAPFDVGWKALAVNLSDLAAMGSAPRAAVLSLAVPDGLGLAACDRLVRGFVDLAGRHRVALIGGNISRSPGPLFIDVTATGTVHRRRILRRAGAQPGDALFVSGEVGAAAAGLSFLRTERARTAPEEDWANEADVPGDPLLAACVERFRRPEPRVRLGVMLGRNGAASACIDLSDGLAAAIRQLADASDVGAVLDAGRLPVAAGAEIWFRQTGRDPLRETLSGGEDYELLITVSSRMARRCDAIARKAGVPLRRIGTITADRRLRVVRDGIEEPLPEGFTHF